MTIDGLETMADRLKPCPHCGGEAQYNTALNCLQEEVRYIHCLKCGCATQRFVFISLGIDNDLFDEWNCRVEDWKGTDAIKALIKIARGHDEHQSYSGTDCREIARAALRDYGEHGWDGKEKE